MSDWLVDLGNTRLKLAPLSPDGTPGLVGAAAHDGRQMAPGWDDSLPAAVGRAWIASVGPATVLAEVRAGLRRRGATVSVAASTSPFLGITGAYDEPSRLGVDRLLAMAAAHAASVEPVLVAGIGTALTVDLVDGEGRHRGGRIAPSPALMREALAQRVPGLPGYGGHHVDFATDTASALASGCLGAALGLIERSRDQAAVLLGRPPRIWAHGGGAEDLLPWLGAARHAPSLVLDGLALWARNGGKAA